MSLFYSAGLGGSAIPDELTDQWPFDEGSGSTVVNEDGSIDLELNGASWEANSNFEGEQAASFDGANDWLVSASRGDWNTSDITICGWVLISSSDDDPPLLDTTGGSQGSVQDEGGVSIDFRTSSDTVSLRLQHLDSGGSGSEIFARGDESVNTDQWYFYAYTASGDAGRLRVWQAESDGGSKVIDNSGTATRGDIDNNKYLHSMGRTDFSRFTDGLTDAFFAAVGAELSESDLNTVREQTDNGR